MSRRTRDDTLLDRFWSKVAVAGKDECWLWTASIKGNGEGQLWMGTRNRAAYLVSWIIHYGDIPETQCVLHKCDNRACVNPNHLFLGTKRDNSEDMVEKGRQWKQPVTHCPQGHPYDDANTRLYRGRRYCRICRYEAKLRLNREGPIAIPNMEKTHCPQGHKYTPANTWKDSNGQRHCRTCNRERQRARRANK